MEFNRLVFPAPDSSYTPFSLDKLLWIPRTRFFSMKRVTNTLESFNDVYQTTLSNKENAGSPHERILQIPCLLHTYNDNSKNYVLYFHGNAEDIGYASEFTKRLSTGLKANIISVEYPGYGIYEGESNAKTILEDAEIVFDYLTHEIGIHPHNIFVFGRSIGSGPATHLAAHRNPGMLILMSAYTTIKDAVKDIAGTWATIFVAERFKNIEEIEKVKCPTFLVHGKKDKLIPYEHTKKLFSKCKCLAAMNLSDTMTHNDFSLSNDIIRPLRKFFRQLEIRPDVGKDVTFPDYLFKIPLKNNRKKGVNSSNSVITECIYENNQIRQ